MKNSSRSHRFQDIGAELEPTRVEITKRRTRPKQGDFLSIKAAKATRKKFGVLTWAKNSDLALHVEIEARDTNRRQTNTTI